MSFLDTINRALDTAAKGAATWKTFDDSPKAKKLADDVRGLQDIWTQSTVGAWGPQPVVTSLPPNVVQSTQLPTVQQIPWGLVAVGALVALLLLRR